MGFARLHSVFETLRLSRCFQDSSARRDAIAMFEGGRVDGAHVGGWLRCMRGKCGRR